MDPTDSEESNTIRKRRKPVNIEGGGKTCLADYEIGKAVGRGKFATVYKATEIRSGEECALKKVSVFSTMDSVAQSKCLKEVKLIQSLQHQNIVQYKDAFVENDELNIVFEWANAGDLKRQIRKALEREAYFDERRIWKFFLEICRAIQHIHSKRIIHRDIKPANIFLMTDGSIKLGDLGLGRSLSENTMEAYSKVGTPLYMAPEVLRSNGYDWKSDIWSLGCILYELAVLRSPFKEEGISLVDLFKKIDSGVYPPLDDQGRYSPELKTLSSAMISQDPAQRPNIDQVCTFVEGMFALTSCSKEKQNGMSRPKLPLPLPWVASPDETSPRIKSERDSKETDVSRKFQLKKTRKDEEEKNLDSERTGSASSVSRKTAPNRAPTHAAKSYIQTKGSSSALLVMEEVNELLKLVGYSQCLSPVYFALDPDSIGSGAQGTNRHAHFKQFVQISSWLLSLLGTTWKPDEMQSPSSVATSLLNVMGTSGVAREFVSSVSPSQLCYGFGLGICLCLKWLTETVLHQKYGFHFKSPDYSFLEESEDTETIGIRVWDDTTECKDEDEIEEDSDIEQDDRGPNFQEEEWYTDKKYSSFGSYGGAGRVSTEGATGKPILLPMVENPEEQDAAKWRFEVERVIPKLKRLEAKLEVGSSWKSRAAKASEDLMHLKSQVESPESTFSQFKRLENLISSQLEKIKLGEQRLKNEFSELCEDHKIEASRKGTLERRLLSHQSVVDDLQSHLEEILSNLEEVESGVKERSATMSDVDSLKRLKQGLQRIRMDIGIMEVQIGVLLAQQQCRVELQRNGGYGLKVEEVERWNEFEESFNSRYNLHTMDGF